MKKSDILQLYDEQERRNSMHPSYQRETAAGVVRHVNLDPTRLSFISHSELTTANADQIIQEQIRWYREQVNGAGLEWKTYDHDTPPDLQRRLIAHGFEPEEREALLILDLENCPDVYLQPVTADVRQVTTEGQFRQIAGIQTAVYNENFDWLTQQLSENVVAQPDYWGIYTAFVDGIPACAAWISFPPNSDFAGLWGGATRAEYRKKGLYTAVVAARAQEALRRGYRFLTVDASDMSRPILEKRGFQLLTYTTPFTWKPKIIGVKS